MAHIVPSNTHLIVDVGTEYTKVGYSGDFHPFIAVTSEIIPGMSGVAVQNSCITDVESYLKILETLAKKHGRDSIIIIEHMWDPDAQKEALLKKMFDKLLFNSVLFLNSAVCCAFGYGKASAMVIELGQGSFTATAVINGVAVEYYKIDGGEQSIIETISQQLLSNTEFLANIQTLTCFDAGLTSNKKTTRLAKSLAAKIHEYCLNGTEPYDLCEVSNLLQNVDVTICCKTLLNSIYSLLDKVMELRDKHGLNRKGNICDAILFSGSLLRIPALVDKCKEYLKQKHSDLADEAFLSNTPFDPQFAGASIVGMNEISMTLFITPNEYYKKGAKVFEALRKLMPLK